MPDSKIYKRIDTHSDLKKEVDLSASFFLCYPLIKNTYLKQTFFACSRKHKWDKK